MQRVVHWRGIDDPERFDEATIDLGDGELSGSGTSRTPHYLLRWFLQTGPAWVTRILEVQVESANWSRSLTLRREDDGRWISDGRATGVPLRSDGQPLTIDGSDWNATDGTPPGIVDAAGLTTALDCDLGLCPVTNTMPMLRSVLPASGSASASAPLSGPEIEFVMAWVEVPSLRVIRSQQVYQLRRLQPDGGALVRYVGLHRSFVGDLSVDADGIVIDYQDLAHRIDQ